MCACDCGQTKVVHVGSLRIGATKSCGCGALRRKDLKGQRFGKLIALEPAPSQNGRGAWLCACDCGQTKIISATGLRTGGTKSCGCRTLRLDLKRERFGKLIALEPAPSQNGRAMWLCACDCGGTKLATASALRSGGNKSCGCLASGPAPIDLEEEQLGKIIEVDLLD